MELNNITYGLSFEDITAPSEMVDKQISPNRRYKGLCRQKSTCRSCLMRIAGSELSPQATSADLQREIEARQDQGEFDKEFSDRYLPTFSFKPSEELKEAKSIVIVAMPWQPTRATFCWKGKKQSFILPPTYTAYDEKRIHVEHIVLEAVGKRRFSA